MCAHYLSNVWTKEEQKLKNKLLNRYEGLIVPKEQQEEIWKIFTKRVFFVLLLPISSQSISKISKQLSNLGVIDKVQPVFFLFFEWFS